MPIISGIRRRLAAVVVKAAGADWLRAFSREVVYGESDSYGVRLFDSMTERIGAMANVGIVYACVNLVAQSFAQVPWHVDRGDGEEIELLALQDLLARPNPDTSGYELLYTIMAHLELTGNAFLYLDSIDGTALFAKGADGRPMVGGDGKLMLGARPHFGQPKQLYILEPDCMRIARTESGIVAGYAYRPVATHQEVPLERDWVIHLKYPHPANRWWGLGPLEAAALELEKTTYAKRWNRNFFRNSARPDGVIEAPAKLSDEAYNRLTQQWNARHKGVDNAHRTAILEGAAYHATSQSNKDMDFLLGEELTREEICSVFGVPPAKIGVLRYANYANSREQDKTFWAETMTPKLALVAAKLTVELVARYDPNLKFVYADMNPRDAVMESQTAVALASAGLRTINELRAEYQWGAALAWGDAWWSPFGVTPRTDAAPQALPPQSASALTVGVQPALPPAAEPIANAMRGKDGTKTAKQVGADTENETAGAEAEQRSASETAVSRPPVGAPREDCIKYLKAVLDDPATAAEPEYKRKLLPLFQVQQREVTAGLRNSAALAALVTPAAESLTAQASRVVAALKASPELAGMADRQRHSASRSIPNWRKGDGHRERLVDLLQGLLGADPFGIGSELGKDLYAGLTAGADHGDLLDLAQAAFAAKVDSLPRRVAGIVDVTVDWSEQTQTFQVAMHDTYGAIIGDAGSAALAEVGVGISFDLANPRAVAALNVIGHRFASDVNATTKQALQDALTAGLQEGEGVPALMDRVTDVFAEAKGYRSEMIARTETARAVNSGRLEGFMQSGVVEKQEWLATLDDRTRDTHAEAHGQIVGLDEPFDVGGEALEYPGDPAGSPEETINCRCASAPIVAGDASTIGEGD